MRLFAWRSPIKKTLYHPKSDAQSRIDFRLKLLIYECIDNRPIVYIDESGFSIDDPRTRGYSLKGTRCYASKDWHAKGRVNAIGSITGFKLFNVCLFDGNINSDVFHTWVTQELLPAVPKNAVIVMDNATFHKRSDTIEAIENNCCSVLFLPPYCPDLNPIEKKWVQAKKLRKKLKCDPYTLFLNSKLWHFSLI